MGLYVKVFEAQNNTIIYGNMPSLIKAVNAGCDFRVADSDSVTHGPAITVTSVWGCNAIYSSTNATNPEMNNVICNTYQFAGGKIGPGFTSGWPNADEFRTNFYAINANPSLMCTTDFLIYQPKVFSDIDNSCGPFHGIWFTDPICYYLAQTGKATNDLEEAMNYLTGENSTNIY